MADKQEKEKNLHAGHRQRMKQRFIDYRFQGMQQHEILEMVLYYAIPERTPIRWRTDCWIATARLPRCAIHLLTSCKGILV